MGLVKCPDCGKMVSERASQCPQCGCPSEYFGIDEKEPEIIETQNIETISFNVAGFSCEYPADETHKTFAVVLGDFVKLSENAKGLLRNTYERSKDIKTALINVPQKANEVLGMTIDLAIKCLHKNGIVMTPERFIQKHYYTNKIDYEEYYNLIVEGYATIMDYQAELEEYRQEQINSRSRWSGGGFGVRGAIKGAVTASLLNAGSDFLHSFGDNARTRADEKKVAQILKNYYEYPVTKEGLCDCITTCVLRVYLALIEELQQSGIITDNCFNFRPEDADILYLNTLEYDQNMDVIVNNILQCIRMWPAEVRFYKAILPAIFETYDISDPNNFNAFLRYWGMEDYFDSFFEEVNESYKEEEEMMSKEDAIEYIKENYSVASKKEAITKFKELTGLGLQESKEVVDDLFGENTEQKESQSEKEIKVYAPIKKTFISKEEAIPQIKEDYDISTKKQAIIKLKDLTGIGLQEAKGIVEKLFENSDGSEEAKKIDDLKKDTIFCPFCGKKISRDAKFCNFCGKEINYGK